MPNYIISSSILCIFFVSNMLLSWHITPVSPFIAPLEVVTCDVVSAIGELRQAYIPDNFDSAAAAAVSVAVADAVAGAVGGIASRKTASIIGDVKKDSLQTKVGASTAFFGARGLIRGASRVLGMPQPLAILCASALGTVVSEAAKAAGRNSDNMLRPIREEKESLNAPEIIGDVSRWLSYDLIFHSFHHESNPLQDALLGFCCGSTAGVLGFILSNTLTLVQQKQHKEELKVVAHVESKILQSVESHILHPLPVAGRRPSVEDMEDDRLKELEVDRESIYSARKSDPLSLNDGRSDSMVNGRALPNPPHNGALNNGARRSIWGTDRVLKAALESGVLFGCFQLTLWLFNQAVPEGSKHSVPFYDWLGALQQEIPAIVHLVQ